MNYRGGVEIPSSVSKSNRTLSLLYARAKLTNEEAQSQASLSYAERRGKKDYEVGLIGKNRNK